MTKMCTPKIPPPSKVPQDRRSLRMGLAFNAIEAAGIYRAFDSIITTAEVLFHVSCGHPLCHFIQIFGCAVTNLPVPSRRDFCFLLLRLAVCLINKCHVIYRPHDVTNRATVRTIRTCVLTGDCYTCGSSNKLYGITSKHWRKQGSSYGVKLSQSLRPLSQMALLSVVI